MTNCETKQVSIIFVISSVFLLSCASSESESAEAQWISRFVPVATLSVGSSTDMTLPLLDPVGFAQLSHGRYAVADNARMRIEIFNHKGEYLHSVGGRGRQPGKYHHFSAFAGSDDELLVVDNLLSRVTSRSVHEGQLSISGISDLEIMWPGSIMVIDSGDIVAVNKMPSVTPVGVIRTGGEFLLHRFATSGDSLKNVYSMLSSKDVYEENNEALERFYRRSPGQIVKITESTVMYVPPLYEGKLWLVSLNRRQPRRKKEIRVEFDRGRPFKVLTGQPDSVQVELSVLFRLSSNLYAGLRIDRETIGSKWDSDTRTLTILYGERGEGGWSYFIHTLHFDTNYSLMEEQLSEVEIEGAEDLVVSKRVPIRMLGMTDDNLWVLYMATDSLRSVKVYRMSNLNRV